MSNITLNNKLAEIKEKTNKYILGLYNRYDVAFKFGVGELLFDTENREYIDFTCGISVTNLGHSDADIIEALREQADKVFHTTNLFYSEEAAILAEAIVLNSFPGKVFFCNSGTEANEAAFKLSRKYALSKKRERPVILALTGSFHGRTASAMSMTGQEKIRTGYGELVPGFDFIEVNNEESLSATFQKHKGNVASLIMELIQGEVGIIPIKESFLKLARKLTRENDALLIFDEIQTGMGRTGKLFCFQHTGISPDAMTLAKSLGSGFPVGAMIVADKFADVMTMGSHGSTFGGNHLAMRVAYETIKIILSREILAHSEGISEFMFTKLRQIQGRYPVIKEVRGKGLHIGVELKIPSRKIAEDCLRKGLVVNSTAENVIRIMPPLNIMIEKADQGLQIFEEVLSGIK